MGDYEKLKDIEVVGFYGRDVKGEYCDEADKVLEYISLPPELDNAPSMTVEWDLNICNPDDEKRQDGTTYEHLFEWIMRNSRNRNGKPCMPDVDFVCKRRHLQNLCLVVEDPNWVLCVLAKRLRGIIYLYVFSEDLQQYREKQKGITSISFGERCGSKFEHYILADTPGGVPNPKRPIHRYDDMALVYRAKVGQHRVLYSGEIDGIPSNADLSNLNNNHFVELKTLHANGKLSANSWWCQSVLSKCDRILLGTHQHGIVYNLKWMSVNELKNNLSSTNWPQQKWSPNRFINSGALALDVIASAMRKSKDDVCLFKTTAGGTEMINITTKFDFAMKEFLQPTFEEWANNVSTY